MPQNVEICKNKRGSHLRDENQNMRMVSLLNVPKEGKGQTAFIIFEEGKVDNLSMQ